MDFLKNVAAYFFMGGIMIFPLALVAFFAFFSAFQILFDEYFAFKNFALANPKETNILDRKIFQKLARKIKFLRVMIICATLLGLLGTVIGMTGVFSGLQGDSNKVALGISQALITTQVGLSTAVVLMVLKYFCGVFLKKLKIRNLEMLGGLSK